MARCEDYPCCGHVEDGQSFCPDTEGRFDCAGCGGKLPKNAPSALCGRCHKRNRERDDYDYPEDDR